MYLTVLVSILFHCAAVLQDQTYHIQYIVGD
jgi:hypothetical protein